LVIARDLTQGAVFLLVWGSLYFTGLNTLFGPAAGTYFGQYSGAVLLLLILGTGRILLLSAVLSTAIGVGLILPHTVSGPAMNGLSPDLLAMLYDSMVINLIVLTAIALLFAMQQIEQTEAQVVREHARSEALLANLLPKAIAARLKANKGAVIADDAPQVTVLFADIVGFTPRAERMEAEAVVAFLNSIFSRFDALTARHGLEKIKTIGDAYMVASGLPEPRADHAHAAAHLALDMLAETRAIAAEMGEELHIRIGLHTGPAVAGVIGSAKLFYDVWGDAVNTAARLESHGPAGHIQVSEAAKQILSEQFTFAPRGIVDLKGKGPAQTCWLIGSA